MIPEFNNIYVFKVEANLSDTKDGERCKWTLFFFGPITDRVQVLGIEDPRIFLQLGVITSRAIPGQTLLKPDSGRFGP